MSLDGSILPPGVLFQDRHRFTGMDVLVVSDDDKRMQDVPEDCIGTDGLRIYVRKTLWTRVRDRHPEEVADLCEGLTQPAAQARYLKRAFKIEAKRKPSGALIVFRHQLEPKAPAQQARPQPNRAAYLALVGKQA